jgi:hypothetical protein
MKSILMPAALALLLAAGLTPAPVQAAGCLKGCSDRRGGGSPCGSPRFVGGWCRLIIGRHEANKHARGCAEQDRASHNQQ